MKLKSDEEKKYEEFWKLNYYVNGSYDSYSNFVLLNNEIKKHEQDHIAHRLYYLALPPTVFESATKHIKTVCMAEK